MCCDAQFFARFHFVLRLDQHMGIQELKIQGYRSFHDVTWRPGRLNLLVGPNGGGKSNLLRLLQFLSDSAAGRLRKAVQNAGGMGVLRWNDEADDIDVRLKAEFGGQKRNEYRLLLALTGSGYEIDAESLRIWRLAPGVEKLIDRFEVETPRIRLGEDGPWSNLDGAAWELSEPVLAQLMPGSGHGAAVLFRRCLLGFTVFSEIGGIDLDAIRAATTTQPAEKLESDGSNLANVLHTLYSDSREFQNDIRLAMNTAFGDEYEELVFSPAAAQQIQLAIRWKSSSKPHSADQLSDGTLRFLLWVTALLTADRTTVVAIDEPEVGLHPNMLSILADYATAAAERTQVVISTHSPEFLDCFTDAEPDVTVCNWEEGESKLYQLAPDQLAPWLKKYRLGHLFTSGDLDVLTNTQVEPIADLNAFLKELPSETAESTVADE